MTGPGKGDYPAKRGIFRFYEICLTAWRIDQDRYMTWLIKKCNALVACGPSLYRFIIHKNLDSFQPIGAKVVALQREGLTNLNLDTFPKRYKIGVRPIFGGHGCSPPAKTGQVRGQLAAEYESR